MELMWAVGGQSVTKYWTEQALQVMRLTALLLRAPEEEEEEEEVEAEGDGEVEDVAEQEDIRASLSSVNTRIPCP